MSCCSVSFEEPGWLDQKVMVLASPEPEPEPEPEQVQDGSGFVLDGSSGDDRLVLTDPDGGLVDGGGGRDDILVDTGAPPDGLVLGWNHDDPMPVRVVFPDPQAGTWTAPGGDEVAVGASHVDLDGDDKLTVGRALSW